MGFSLHEFVPNFVKRDFKFVFCVATKIMDIVTVFRMHLMQILRKLPTRTRIRLRNNISDGTQIQTIIKSPFIVNYA